MNTIGFALQQTLSGSDYDSDTVLLVDNPKLLELAKVCNSNFMICVNALDAETTQYNLNNHDKFVIDDKLSISQRLIGEVTNIAQHLMSKYWNMLSKGKEDKDILKKINVLTVLQGVSIDLAKKLYDVDFEGELQNNSITDDKPLFFKYISRNKNIKNKITKYSCPMDFLQEVITVQNANQKEDVCIMDLLIKQSLKNANRKQQTKIFELTNEMCSILNGLYAIRAGTDDHTKEIDRQIDDVISEYNQKIKNRKMKTDTMYGLLLSVINSGGYVVRQLNALYKAYPEIFINSFKNKSSQSLDNVS